MRYWSKGRGIEGGGSLIGSGSGEGSGSGRDSGSGSGDASGRGSSSGSCSGTYIVTSITNYFSLYVVFIGKHDGELNGMTGSDHPKIQT